ncbi:MAG TPA: diguanylate cyclase [Bacillota bacterium]|nr:diguanylate cyclase [Bacillota bacterium]
MLKTGRLDREIRKIFQTYSRKIINEFRYEYLSSLLSELGDHLECKFLNVYYYNEWTCLYKKVLELSSNVPFERFIEDKVEKFEPVSNFFVAENQKYFGQEIEIDSLEKPVYFIVHISEHLNERLLFSLSEEMELFLQLFFLQMNNDREKTFHHLLNELTEKIYTTSNEQRVLTYFVSFFESAYPEIDYELLLSQGSDFEEDLPVKKLSVEGHAEPFIEEVFLSGEVRRCSSEDCFQLYLPLHGSQSIYGVLKIEMEKMKQIPEKDIKILQQFAHVCGQALENVYLYQHSISLVENLKNINKVTKELNKSSEISALTKIIKKYIHEASYEAEIGIIFFEDGNLDNYTISNYSTSYFLSHYDKNFLQMILYRCFQSSRIFTGNLRETIEQAPFESLIAIPMIQTDEHIGCVVIGHPKQYYFSFETFKFFQSLIQHYTLTVSNTMLKNRLEEAVITDYLTRLYSRNYLDEMIEKHMLEKGKGVLVLFDIDDFKEINDTYGHSVGDEVIIQIARTIQKHIYPSEIAARWGGEELALYLPDKTAEKGYLRAKHILSEVEKMTNPQVTLSCGIAAWKGTYLNTVRQLFNRADEALYQAKHLGKNQIVIYDDTKTV